MELSDKHFRCMEVNPRYVQLIENETTMLCILKAVFSTGNLQSYRLREKF